MKKYFPFNSRKFVLVDSRHNIFHWLFVVFLRIVTSAIMIPLSLYFIAIGYLISADTIDPFLPESLIEKANYYSAQLPYFQFIKQFIFSQLGHWYQDAFVWWGMVVGIPLILLGISVFFSNFFSFYYTIFSPRYNRTHCFLCKEPIKII